MCLLPVHFLLPLLCPSWLLLSGLQYLHQNPPSPPVPKHTHRFTRHCLAFKYFLFNRVSRDVQIKIEKKGLIFESNIMHPVSILAFLRSMLSSSNRVTKNIVCTDFLGKSKNYSFSSFTCNPCVTTIRNSKIILLLLTHSRITFQDLQSQKKFLNLPFIYTWNGCLCTEHLYWAFIFYIF